MNLRLLARAAALTAALVVAAIPMRAQSVAEWLQVTAAVTVGLNQAVEKAQALGPVIN